MYYYSCVCGNDHSDIFHFTAKQSGNEWVPNLLIFGGIDVFLLIMLELLFICLVDMGRTLGPQALPSLISEVKSGWPHAAIHIGKQLKLIFYILIDFL